MKRIVVDATQCAGCRVCEMACSYTHEGVFSPNLSRVVVIKEDKYGLDYPIYCHQCNECPPAISCPASALSIDDVGARVSDTEACTSCGLCAKVCKYNAVSFDKSSKPLICDLCAGDPVCVKKCPTKALSFIETEEMTDQPEDIFRELRVRWGIDA